jgi:hypothetical protein
MQTDLHSAAVARVGLHPRYKFDCERRTVRWLIKISTRDTPRLILSLKRLNNLFDLVSVWK